MIYLDNAATSFPKPPEVLAAMQVYLATGGNPGRSGHRLAKASDKLIWDARRVLAGFLGGDQPERIVFTGNATTALNIAIKGLVGAGDRVLTSSFEHNAVVRPLHSLRDAGVDTTEVPPAADSPVDLDWLEAALRPGKCRVVVVAHASNVTGAVAPVRAIHQMTQAYGATLIVDAAQTAGHLPVSCDDADVLVFAGHKALYGPQGTGGMYVSERVNIRPLLHGGTGGRSEVPHQPRWLPFALESGTPNGVGIAGLAAGVRYVSGLGVAAIAEREGVLRRRLVDGLRELPGVRLHEWRSAEPPAPVVSATMEGRASTEVAELLEERHGVLVRAGLHCAPLAHRTLHTIEEGTVRFAVSHLNTLSEVVATIAAAAEIARLCGAR